MLWIIAHPTQYVDKPNLGNQQCAGLVQYLNQHIPTVTHWKRGAQVSGNASLPQGTVIAVFNANGDYVGQKRYPYGPGTAHTAIYVRQNSEGIYVVHQFTHKNKPELDLVQFKFIRFGGTSGGSLYGGTLEDNADNYYVVELKQDKFAKRGRILSS
jgi:hypothetical protein